MTRPIAVVSFAQMHRLAGAVADDVEMVQGAVSEALAQSGLPRSRIGFVASGSCDLLTGQPFAFVAALDGVGAWPPISESHVEMDGAWALYEAYIRLQHGDVDAALVYAFGRASAGDLPEVLALQLDPYCVAPLWPDAISLAALQARCLLESGRFTRRDFAEVVVRSRRDANANPALGVESEPAPELLVDALLEAPALVDPLTGHDCATASDGAAAIVLAAGDLAREVCPRPAWIAGIDHRIESHSLGLRDLTRSPSTELAGKRAGLPVAIEVAELHAPFSHQELILREALAVNGGVRVNPSGGALGANPTMVAGLIRLGEAARSIHSGQADRALGHATSGTALQQNLVCLLETR